jgi:hypothetical protein
METTLIRQAKLISLGIGYSLSANEKSYSTPHVFSLRLTSFIWMSGILFAGEFNFFFMDSIGKRGSHNKA